MVFKENLEVQGHDNKSNLCKEMTSYTMCQTDIDIRGCYTFEDDFM